MELKWKGVFPLEDLANFQDIEGIKDGGIYLHFLEVEGSKKKRIIYVGTATKREDEQGIYGRLMDYYDAYKNSDYSKSKREYFSTYVLKNMNGKNIYEYFRPGCYDDLDNKGVYYIITDKHLYSGKYYEGKDIDKTNKEIDNHRKYFLGKLKFAFVNIDKLENQSDKEYEKYLKTFEAKLISHLVSRIQKEYGKDYGYYSKNNHNGKYTCFGQIQSDEPYSGKLENNFDEVVEKEWFEDFAELE
ncbi:MAG: hypothetical protein WC644_01115 [Ignavibacteria bacterium]